MLEIPAALWIRSTALQVEQIAAVDIPSVVPTSVVTVCNFSTHSACCMLCVSVVLIEKKFLSREK